MNGRNRSLWRRLTWPLAGVVLTGAMLAARLSHAAVRPESGLGLPKDVSEHGWRIDLLTNMTHVFNIILFVIMCIWMGLACFKHGKDHEAEYDHGDSKRNVTVALSLSAVIFAVVDGNLFVQTIIGLDKVLWNWSLPANDPSTVKVQLNAHQWAWDFRYSGPDEKFSSPTNPSPDDIVTWNELRVPVNTPVYLQLAATDVIHSFYLPNLRVKMDAVPGQVNRVWFQAKEIGEFDIGCAQHCGTHHYKMKGKLVVMPQDEFQKWQAEAAEIARRSFDPTDITAQWGWEWKEF